MSDNVIKSEDLPKATKKPAAKKAAAKKVEVEESLDQESSVEEHVEPKKSPLPKKNIPSPGEGKAFIYFDSGSAYSTKSGLRFSRDRRIYEISIEDAEHLLSFDNFRIPSQTELEEYYLENN